MTIAKLDHYDNSIPLSKLGCYVYADKKLAEVIFLAQANQSIKLNLGSGAGGALAVSKL